MRINSKAVILSAVVATYGYAGGNVAEATVEAKAVEPIATKQQMMKGNRVPLGNINGSTGNVFKKGMFRVVLKDVYFKADRAYSGDDKINDPLNRAMKVNMANFVARYGLGNGFDIRAVIPIVKKELSMTNPKNGRSSKLKTSGVGDIALVGRYELMNQMKGDPLFLSIGAGVKFATGKTDKKYRTPQGMKIIPGLQNGTGSTDFIFELGATKILPNSRVDASATYVKRGDGKRGYDFGNVFRWNLGYSYAVTKQFDLQLELDGLYRAKNSLNGNKLACTGGNTVYLTPGFHYRVTKHFDVSAGVAVPIYRDINYNSAKRKGGLSEKSRLIVRVGYTF